jgi:hypothetical protein
MAIIARGEMLSAEWLDEDDVDLSGVLVPQEIKESDTMPIITIEEHLAYPWEDGIFKKWFKAILFSTI